ncbi:MAG: polysaccharide biosynthesis/export family protein [Cyanobacteria bacterium P01_F01_bin.56]
MDTFRMLKGARLPISALLISQVLALGCIRPSSAQSLPDSSIHEEPTPDVFAPLEPPPNRSPNRLPTRRDARTSNPAQNIPVYLLGPGDNVRFDVFNVPELTNDESGNRLVTDNIYRILADGTISLPWIGSVYVTGLSLDEAAAVVAREYETFIFDPVVTLSLSASRPIRIAVAGEVDTPGAYTTRQEGAISTEVSVAELRTVAQAIQNAGGITQLADIRNIELIRPQPDGSRDIIPIDFFALLVEGDQTQNALLRDGDTVFVPTATALTPEEARTLATASFAQDIITVDVVGEVDAPGRIDIEPNSTLNQAILAAGGFADARARTAEVTFIRVNPNGTVEKRDITVDLAAGIDGENNPPLQENDIVIVSRSGIAQASDFLDLLGNAASSILDPVLGIFNILNIIDDINEDDDNNN